MPEAVKNITYRQPLTGTSTSNPTYTEGGTQVGGQNILLVADMTTQQLLEGILIELKKLNLRQQEAFEETVKDEDV
jgi:hypothetical protein